MSRVKQIIGNNCILLILLQYLYSFLLFSFHVPACSPVTKSPWQQQLCKLSFVHRTAYQACRAHIDCKIKVKIDNSQRNAKIDGVEVHLQQICQHGWRKSIFPSTILSKQLVMFPTFDMVSKILYILSMHHKEVE